MWTASHPHDLGTIQKADLPSKRMSRCCAERRQAYTPEVAHGSYSERLSSSVHKRIHIARARPASCRRYNGPPSVHPDAHRCFHLCSTRESSSPIKYCYQNADGESTFCKSRNKRIPEKQRTYICLSDIFLPFYLKIRGNRIDNFLPCCII